MPSKRFCGGKKKHKKVELNFSNSASSQAQTVSTSGNALLLGKPFNLGCHRVKPMYGFAVFISEEAVWQPF